MDVRRRRGDAAYVVSVVSGGHFLSHLYLLAYPPLFPLLGREFGVSTAQLGLLVTAIYVPTLLFQFPLGELVDRVGAKRILVAGIAVTGLGIAASGLVTAYWMLLACAFVSGIGQSVFHPADYALLDTVTDADNEGLAFSAHTFAGFAGFAAAPTVVGLIGIRVGWQTVLVAMGLFGFLYASLLSLTTESVHTRRVQDRERDDSNSVGQSVRELLSFVRRRDLLFVFAFYLLSMMAIVGLQSFTTVLAVESYGLSEATANTLLTAHLASTAVGVVAGGPLADRLPSRGVIVATFLLSAVTVWAVVVLSNPAFVVPLVLLSAVGLLIGSALPSRDKFANALADREATGKSFGFFFTGLSLGAVVSPALLGFVIDTWSSGVAFALVGGFLVAATAVVVVSEYSGRESAGLART